MPAARLCVHLLGLFRLLRGDQLIAVITRAIKWRPDAPLTLDVVEFEAALHKATLACRPARPPMLSAHTEVRCQDERKPCAPDMGI